jgi:plastocyanin
MMARRISVVLVAFAATAYVACFSEHATGPQQNLTAICNVRVSELLQGGVFVPMRGFEYQIDTLRVQQGTRVTWVNCEAAGADEHTITSDDGVWDSPFVPVGATFSRTFDVRGTFPYHCIPHPLMRAVVIVE